MHNAFAAFSSAGGAIITQFVLAGVSLLLQAIAARSLGAETFAHYVLIYGALVLTIAIYTSWFGDALTVFDRFDQRIRVSLLHSMICGVILGTVLVGALAWSFLDAPESGAAAVVAGTWIISESTRRVFTARGEFWRLALNDLFGAGVTTAILVLSALTGGGLTLTRLFLAMAVGNIGAALLARYRLPADEFRFSGLHGGAMGDLVRFSGWRAAQSGVRPFSLLLSRIMIAALGGAAGLANVEAARLLLAPALAIANGSGSYFLSTYARAGRTGSAPRSRDAVRGTLALGGCVATIGAVTTMFSGPLGRALTGGSFEVDPLTVAGWAVYTVVFAATLPMTSLATTRKQSRFVFWLRTVEMTVGLSILLVTLVLNETLVWLAPYCLSLGGTVTGLLLWEKLRRGDATA